jgi:aldose 1-epimerase
MRVVLAVLLVALICAPASHSQSKGKPMEKSKFKFEPKIEKTAWGKTPEGEAVDLFTMTNHNGLKVKISTYGGIITEIWTPDKDGKLADITLGHDTLQGYVDGHPYFGAITGRVANRIAKGKFTLDGKEYTLVTNNSPNHLHGGTKGFDKKVWRVMSYSAVELHLQYVSKDGEEGYPGKLETTVSYLFDRDNRLLIVYKAKTDKATPVNLTNHAYFNLGGHDSGDILGHRIEIFADKYTPTDDTLIPTGKIESVTGTPYDFTTAKEIGKDIKQLKGDPVGYDINYVLRDKLSSDNTTRKVAFVVEPRSGRTMLVQTTEPGVQFYTGNFLNGKDKGKGGAVYKQYAGLCLETQHFPDSINQRDFPTVVLKPRFEYRQTTFYEFGVEGEKK